MLVHQHDDGLFPRAVGRGLRAFVAWAIPAVLLALQPINQRVGDVAASVEAHIQNHALLAAHVFVGLALEAGLILPAHRADVQVAELPAGRGLHVFAQALGAVLVLQIVPVGSGENLVFHLPRAVLLRLLVHEELELAVLPVVDELVELLVQRHVLPVDGEHVVARLNFRLLVGTRRARRHLRHADARPGMRVIKGEAQVRRHRLRHTGRGSGNLAVR